VELVILILILLGVLAGRLAYKFVGAGFSRLMSVLNELCGEVKELRTTVEKLRPIDMGDIPFVELAKEAKRREMLITQILESLSNVVAAGISKAFKK
jgi:hypothetical protein